MAVRSNWLSSGDVYGCGFRLSCCIHRSPLPVGDATRPNRQTQPDGVVLVDNRDARRRFPCLPGWFSGFFNSKRYNKSLRWRRISRSNATKCCHKGGGLRQDERLHSDSAHGEVYALLRRCTGGLLYNAAIFAAVVGSLLPKASGSIPDALAHRARLNFSSEYHPAGAAEALASCLGRNC